MTGTRTRSTWLSSRWTSSGSGSDCRPRDAPAGTDMRHDSQPPSVDDPEDRALRELVAAGEIDRATEAAIRRYGPELLGWLLDTLPRADAEEAFSNLSLELWRSLARYDGRCSIRTWCYTLEIGRAHV